MRKYFSKELVKIIFCFILFIISSLLNNPLKITLVLVSYIIISFNVYKEAYESLRQKELFNESTLMILATLGALYIGYYDEALMVMLLFELGEYLSNITVEKSKKSIINLMDLRVEKINIERDGKIIEQEIDKAKENDIFIVRPGEKIPLDGIVIEGNSYVDTSSLTGESVQKRVTIDDQVLSGFINQDSILKIKSTSTIHTSTATKIISLIENYDDSKSKTEKFITKFSKIYTPVVVFLALLIIIIPSMITKDFNTWLYRGLVFLVTSCPCALVLSVPLGYFCGMGVSSKNGAIIKGGNILDILSDIDYVLLDKTGTITEGVFEVVKISPKDITEEEFMQYVASAEKNSIHPISKAIKEKYSGHLKKITNYQELCGKGITCKIDNKKILIGNKKLLDSHNIKYSDKNKEGTIVYLAIDSKYCGYLIISDKIKESNRNLGQLQKEINKDLVILSGDSNDIVKRTANEIGIKEYYGELLPEEKLEKVEYYSKKGRTIFIGDGINDAPSLSRAHIGVSVGNIASDAAIEASDIVLMNDNLNTLAKIIRISKETKRKVKISIVFTLTVKILILILTVFGLTNVWLAVFADVGITLLSIGYVLTISCKKY